MKKKTISVLKYPPHEMAFIQVNEKSVYIGNYGDFYIGCHGTIIAGFDLTGIWNKGIFSLASCLKSCLEKHGYSVEMVSKKLSTDEYKALGF